ncbi:cupin domain-containing protein [Brucella pseudogrignonensis]|uniref:cupin domain-containing protein n=1 Tax=Brucella pseudogrignonensis TaxID=419475 RepID=UPI0028BAC2E2|nr:cupin domain-containing protein [Brucella pseudogrignonensis]MDT6942152.1 cupin domain-containing protein [Brucella pseudogrignonensis]
MSLLIRIDPDPKTEPVLRDPLPERLISKSPKLKSWEQDISREDISTGIFEATPGVTHSIKGEAFEFCHIISGEIELTPDGGQHVRFKAGDSFVMKPGFTGVWNTIETVRKIYVAVK